MEAIRKGPGQEAHTVNRGGFFLRVADTVLDWVALGRMSL